MQNLIGSLLTSRNTPKKTYSIPLPKYSFQFFLVTPFLPVWIRPIWLVFMSKTCFTHKRMNLFTFFTFVASFDISAITLSILMTASMPWCLNSLSYIGSDWPFQKFIFLCFSFYCNVSKYRPKSFATLFTLWLYDCKSHVVVDLFNWFDPQALSKNNWVKENELIDGAIGTVRGVQTSFKAKYATTCFWRWILATSSDKQLQTTWCQVLK